jgi:hypothetical protein
MLFKKKAPTITRQIFNNASDLLPEKTKELNVFAASARNLSNMVAVAGTARGWGVPWLKSVSRRGIVR